MDYEEINKNSILRRSDLLRLPVSSQIFGRSDLPKFNFVIEKILIYERENRKIYC